MNKAKIKATEGGYMLGNKSDAEMLIDPKFFQALGKAEGKGLRAIKDIDNSTRHSTYENWWEYQWHRFIDRISSGGSIDKFFEDLINGKSS